MRKGLVIVLLVVVAGGLFYWFNPFTSEYTRTVHFQIAVPSNLNPIKVGVRGNIPPLSWDKTTYLAEEDSIYESVVTFNSSIRNLEYKYIVENPDLVWELNQDMNRTLEYRYNKVEKWNNYAPTRPAGLDTIILSSNKLMVDFTILEKALDELHPSLTKYQSEQAYQNNLQKLKKAWERNQKKPEAYVHLARFLATIRCGHTQLNPFNQIDRTKKSLIKRKNKLPFTFVMIDDQAYIDKALDGINLQKGDEIKAIEKIAWQEIVEQCLTIARGDGSNDQNRISRIPLIGNGDPEFFDVYFPLLFSLPNDSLSVVVQRVEPGNLESVKVPLVSTDSRTEGLKKKYPSLSTTYEDLWKWNILPGNIGYLKLGTYTTWNFKFNWEEMIVEAMEKFETNKVEDIIIDIRGNEGGNDEVLEVLAKYAQTKPMTAEGYPDVLKYQKVSDEIRPYLRTWSDELYNVKLFTKEYKDGYFIRRGESLDPETRPASKDALDARFHYLVDATNSSATFIQSRLIKENKLGTLIGETTGGNYRGITGGYMFFLTLPESGFTVDIPLATTLMPEGTPDKGVTPDVEVKYTYEGFMAGKDDVLVGAVEYIRGL